MGLRVCIPHRLLGCQSREATLSSEGLGVGLGGAEIGGHRGKGTKLFPTRMHTHVLSDEFQASQEEGRSET